MKKTCPHPSAALFFFLLTTLSILLAWGSPATAMAAGSHSSERCAVVTLIYSDDGDTRSFTLGAEVLGYSLRYHLTSVPMIALVTESTSDSDRALLRRAGWAIQNIRTISNPNAQHAERLDYIYSKLQIWDMVDYDRIVYLDADTQVFANIDELCSCPATVAASLRGPFFNAGVMVVSPSRPFFETMRTVMTTTPSYTGGDQGFLNTFFYDFQRCPYYDPRIDIKAVQSGNLTLSPMEPLPGSVLPPDASFTCLRLPPRYNGDLGIAIARGGQWVLEPFMTETYPAVLHYTLAFMKPWQWWSYPVVIDHWQWWDTYSSYSGTYGFRWAAFFVFVIPVVLFWGCFRERLTSRRLGAAAGSGGKAVGGQPLPIGYCPAACTPSSHRLSRLKLLVLFQLGNLLALLVAWQLSNLTLIHPFANAAVFVIYYLTVSDLVLHLLLLPLIDHYGLNTQDEERLITRYEIVSLIGLSALMSFLMLNYINIFFSVIAFIIFVLPFVVFQTWFILSLASMNDQDIALN